MAQLMKRVWLLVLVSAVVWFSPISAHAQGSSLTLNNLDQAHLDSLAALTAKKIREAKLAEKEPKVLVIDFFRNSPGESSQLGTVFADRFSESLASYSAGMQILDRKIIRDYLMENWTTLDDLKSNEVCFAIARQLGATGTILGTLTESKSNIALTLHLEGFGPTEKEDDIFAWRDRTISFALTEDLHAAMYKPGPNYSRTPDKIPAEPGVFIAGAPGVSQPQCKYCPNPDYSDAARAAQFQGTTVLSVLVTARGEVTGIYVLRGGPFGLTDKAIKATRSWQFQPGQKDGQPVPVRVSVEITFRLLSGPQ